MITSSGGFDMTKKNSLFHDCYNLFTAEKKTFDALKDHPQISLLIDILSRKENHHVCLTGIASSKIKFSLLEALASFLKDENIPKALRGIEFFYLDSQKIEMTSENFERIFADFSTFKNTSKRVLIAIDHFEQKSSFGKLIEMLQEDECYRFILLNSPCVSEHFRTIQFTPPFESQLLKLLKSYKLELETFHDVHIPDETLQAALTMASHYLPNQCTFDQTLELLDSAAARVSGMERDINNTSKPHVTNSTLSFIISSWTHIPITHLQTNLFQSGKFMESLQRNIFGQESAILAISTVLQQACVKLREKSGPLCSFLFVGPDETGKTLLTKSLAEHLFGHKGAFLQVNLDENYGAIADVKILPNASGELNLLKAIQKIPYAVILLENIQQTPISIINLFKTILAQGYALDALGIKYNFEHAIIVITTNLGAEKITHLMQAPTTQETNRTLDLMQLVLNEHPQEMHPHVNQNLTSSELCEELIPVLESHFSNDLLQHLNTIPFLPLDYSALEKVMRLKVKTLVKHLETQFGIELAYAPEVIKFLAHEALWRKPQSKSLEKVVEQHLYTAVANEIIAHADDKNRSKRLLLQLNDHGQLLRCEFVSPMGSLYSL